MKKLLFSLSLNLILLASYNLSYGQWKAQRSGTTDNLYSVFFTDENNGWAVGGDSLGNSVILNTNNGGAGWAIQHTDTTGSLYSVCFTDADHGYAVGWVGTIITTTDAGQHWINQNINYGQNLNSVYFINTTTGFIAGDKGLILATTNGGESWKKQTTGFYQNLGSINFGTATQNGKTFNVGYIVGDSGTILFSSNLGETWSKQVSNTPYYLSSVSNIFTNGSLTYVCGNYDNTGIIMFTGDAGYNWTVMDVGINESLTNTYFANINTGFITGSNGTIIKTTDGGNHWMVEKSGTSNMLNSVCFIGSDFVGYVVGDNGTILKTTDGGVGINELTNNNELLSANIYPNPVTNNAIISYELPLKSQVTISLYNLTGKEILSLINEEQDKGSYSINFNANNLDSGIYFCTLKAGEKTITKKIVKISN